MTNNITDIASNVRFHVAYDSPNIDKLLDGHTEEVAELLRAEATRRAGDTMLEDAIANARRAGATWRDIATFLGRDHSSIKRWYETRTGDTAQARWRAQQAKRGPVTDPKPLVLKLNPGK